MRFLVTGGAGFIGSHVVDRILAIESAEVRVYDNFDDFYPGKEKNVNQGRNRQRLAVCHKDILDFKSLLRCMKDCDYVVHLAAQPGVRYSLENPDKTTSVNILGTLNVLKAARILKPYKIIFASSSSIYGAQKVTPVGEDAPTRPLSIYGASKLAGENYCIAYKREYGLPVTILRLHTVYGPRQRPDMAIAKWFKILKQGGRPIVYGDGTQRRDFTYASDVVDGMISAIFSGEATGEIINLGSGATVSVMRVLELIGEVAHIEISPVFEKPRLDEPTETHADIRKAEKILGYRPKVAIEQGITLYHEWYETRL